MIYQIVFIVYRNCLLMTLVYSNNDLLLLEQRCNSELTKVNNWMDANKLTINPQIPSCFTLNHKLCSSVPLLNFLYNNSVIRNIDCITYLKVKLDPYLTFWHHINTLKRKISRNVGVLFKLNKFLTPSALPYIIA